MQVTNIQKNINSTPRKLRLVVDMVRKMKPNQAIQALEFTAQRAAKPLSNAIKTALANARQQGLDTETVVFKSLEINEGMTLKRGRIIARSRTSGYKKRTSHIKVVLTDEGSQN